MQGLQHWGKPQGQRETSEAASKSRISLALRSFSQNTLYDVCNVLTLRGSCLVNIVTSGMYAIATTDPTIHILKYKVLNQSCWFEPALMRKSQKQSSIEILRIKEKRISELCCVPSRCVTLRGRYSISIPARSTEAGTYISQAHPTENSSVRGNIAAFAAGSHSCHGFGITVIEGETAVSREAAGIRTTKRPKDNIALRVFDNSESNRVAADQWYTEQIRVLGSVIERYESASWVKSRTVMTRLNAPELGPLFHLRGHTVHRLRLHAEFLSTHFRHLNLSKDHK